MSKEIVVNEIHKQARKNFPRRHVVMKGIDDLWQADLIDMQSVSNDNLHFKYILAIIDTFSKYAWVYPLKKKNKEYITEAFSDLLRKNRIPKNLQTDLGTEFYNKKLKSLLDLHKINHYSTYSTKKASIVERFIRTLKNMLYKQFSLQGNYKWVGNTLTKVINVYNNTIHRTIGLKPSEVSENNKNVVFQKYKTLLFKRNSTKENNKFAVGDAVRISKYKGTFEKGYTPNWSTEIFTISKVQNTNPITFLIEDARQRPILGSFYAQELQKPKYKNIYLVEKVLRKSGRKLYVKWLGLSPQENSWIDKTEIL